MKDGTNLIQKFKVACGTGDLNTVKELLQNEEVKKQAAARQNEAFRDAARNGHTDILKELLKIPEVIKNTTVLKDKGIYKTNDSYYEILMLLATDIDSKNVIHLIMAAKNGDLETVLNLLDIDEVKKNVAAYHNEALYAAAINHHIDIVKVLLVNEEVKKDISILKNPNIYKTLDNYYDVINIISNDLAITDTSEEDKLLREINDKYSDLNSNVIIQDNLIINTCGEFGLKGANETLQKEKVLLLVSKIIADVSRRHQAMNCDNDGNILPENKNNITRAISSEFTFYTKTPFSISDFQDLQQDIVDLAQKQPANLHLLLSSFAVRTPDNRIMNTTVYIECGKNPRIKLIVKNNPSHLDPVYIEDTDLGRISLTNIDIKQNPEIHPHTITINGKEKHFSFNNVFDCKSVGGNQFTLCADICYDHNFGVAKNNLYSKIHENIKKNKYNPEQYSQVVTANSINLVARNLIGKKVTHADPQYSKNLSNSLSMKQFSLVHFGDPLRRNLIIFPSQACELLPASELSLIRKHNMNAMEPQFEVSRRPTPLVITPLSESTTKEFSEKKPTPKLKK